MSRTVRVPSYSDLRGYSDKVGEGGRVVIRVHVLSELLWISEWTADKTRHHWTSLAIVRSDILYHWHRRRICGKDVTCRHSIHVLENIRSSLGMYILAAVITLMAKHLSFVRWSTGICVYKPLTAVMKDTKSAKPSHIII